jgi:hypothetical protein
MYTSITREVIELYLHEMPVLTLKNKKKVLLCKELTELNESVCAGTWVCCIKLT